jgi:hypothetical protein
MLAEKNRSLLLFIQRPQLSAIMRVNNNHRGYKKLTSIEKEVKPIPAKGYIKPPKHDFL